MYLVDLEGASFEQVVDWNDQSIDWQGRGADRGLRGIAFYRGLTLAAASDELFFYDQTFRIVDSYRCHYLKHCHEIYVENDLLYLTSTGFDSILVFDLLKRQFINAYCYRDLIYKGRSDSFLRKLFSKAGIQKIRFYSYNPAIAGGPSGSDTTHINNVFVQDGNIFFSGTRMDHLMRIGPDDQLSSQIKIPKGTHNVQPLGDSFIMNNTQSDGILQVTLEGRPITSYSVEMYKDSQLLHSDLSKDHARQGFARGLCTYGEYLIAGSSPATLSVYHKDCPLPIRRVTLSLDIRNAIHGLEVYPYAGNSKNRLPTRIAGVLTQTETN
jgi:hypothetical protein